MGQPDSGTEELLHIAVDRKQETENKKVGTKEKIHCIKHMLPDTYPLQLGPAS